LTLTWIAPVISLNQRPWSINCKVQSSPFDKICIFLFYWLNFRPFCNRVGRSLNSSEAWTKDFHCRSRLFQNDDFDCCILYHTIYIYVTFILNSDTESNTWKKKPKKRMKVFEPAISVCQKIVSNAILSSPGLLHSLSFSV
jgi:hypothetical protein